MDTALNLRLRLSRDPLGYWLGEEFRDGFPDDPGLPVGARRRIAAWARRHAPNEVSESQAQALRSPAETSGSAALQEAERQGIYERSSLWGCLTDSERELVRRPSLRYGLASASYPLSIGQLSALSKVEPATLRYWNDVGILPAHRTEGGQRRFFAIAAMRAFALRRLGPQGITILREVSQGSEKAATLLAGVSMILREQAAAMPAASLEDPEVFERAASSLSIISKAFARQHQGA